MRPNRRHEIIKAAIREVARHGVSGSTIRRIAAEAGVTEGAIYRHFASKEELCQEAYSQIVAEMAAQKQEIMESGDDIRTKFESWVRVTYEFFDRFPEAFTYVLLTQHDFPPSIIEISTRQGRMLMTVMEQAVQRGEMTDVSPRIAMSHFTGIMLNIPRMIADAVLEGPAIRYLDEVTEAVSRIFELHSGSEVGALPSAN